MKNLRFRSQAFTLIELLVVIAIIAILASLVAPAINDALVKGKMTQTMNNLKQIHLATFRMSTDASTESNVMLGWPGTLAESTATDQNGKSAQISTGSQFMQRLIDEEYINKADMIKLCQASDIQPWNGTAQFADENNPFKIYKVKDSDVSSAIFAATKNFKYNGDISATDKPYGDKGFVLVQKGGSALIFTKAKASKNPQGLGLLPGRKDLQDSPTESNTDFLQN